MKKKQELFDPENHALAEQILRSSSPSEVKKLGRQVRNFDEEVWIQKRYWTMLEALILKFTFNKDIRAKLLATGDALLVEASPKDKIWGIGLDAERAKQLDPMLWPGQNLLGKALMYTRAALRTAAE